MNGRLYDPLVGRFLSVDPYIQDPGFTQEYNRYSYCLNNPLRYTDPSGYKKAPVKEDAFIMDYANYWNRRTLHGGGGGSSLNSFFRSSGVGRNTSSWLSNDYFVKSAYREGSYSSFVTSIETAMWNKGMTITGSGFHFQSGALPTYASEYSITGNAIAEISAYAINPHTNNWDFSRFEGAAGGGAMEAGGRPSYTPPPGSLPGFSDAERIRPKGGRPRWKLPDGDIGEWDGQHGELERYNPRGKHKGVWNPEGKQIKPPVPGRTIDPYFSPNPELFRQIVTGGLIVGGAAIIIFDIMTIPSGEGMVGVMMINRALAY
jgi:hypothetical protein